jgi:glycosyltransferase involved in cell wall biosynthesis
MACGLPVIVADNTGMKDLITSENCIPLRSQTPINANFGGGMEGWGESDVDEMLAGMEALYTDTARRKRIGEQAARWIVANRTWQKHAAELKEFVLSLG